MIIFTLLSSLSSTSGGGILVEPRSPVSPSSCTTMHSSELLFSGTASMGGNDDDANDSRDGLLHDASLGVASDELVEAARR